MERISRLTAAAVLLGITGWVNATPMTFTDTVDPEPNVFVSANDTSLAFQHDVNPATDTILSASCLIDFGDDSGNPADGTERAEIYLDGVLVATGHNPVNDFSHVFAFPFTSLIDGLLDGFVVTIARPGDGALGLLLYSIDIDRQHGTRRSH